MFDLDHLSLRLGALHRLVKIGYDISGSRRANNEDCRDNLFSDTRRFCTCSPLKAFLGIEAVESLVDLTNLLNW